MASSLESLPSELLSSIFRLLNPLTLIACSQTCGKFRSLINPTRQHFVERLLALECLEEFGGRPLDFRARDNKQEPPWDDEATKKMLWACAHCYRLLNHTHFDNHSLLRLGIRKPLPGTPAALPCTSWEPSGLVVSKSVQQSRKAALRAELKHVKKQYAIAVTENWGWGGLNASGQPRTVWDRLQAYDDAGIHMPINREVLEDTNNFDVALQVSIGETEILDNVATAIEARICGYKRHTRKCNECRYKTGNLRSHLVVRPPGAHGDLHPFLAGSNLGTEKVPIVRSRLLQIGTRMQRYFPSFLENLPSYTSTSRSGPSFRIYRRNSQGSIFATYMVRCPQCESYGRNPWQEMAAFRCGNYWPKWWPAHQHRWGENLWQNWNGANIDREFVDGLLCHACYAAVYGREALAKVLLEWYIKILIADMWTVHQNFTLGWSYVWRSVNHEDSKYVRPGDWCIPDKMYHFDIRSKVLAGLPWKDPHDKHKGVSVVTSDNAVLRAMNRKHKILKQNWNNWYTIKPFLPSWGPQNWNDWFMSWVDGYDNLEAQWLWFRACKQEILNRPETLVNWALGDGGSVDVQVQNLWKQTTEELSTAWSSPEIRNF